MNIWILSGLAVFAFSMGLWVRMRRNRMAGWQKYLTKSIKAFESGDHRQAIIQAQKALKLGKKELNEHSPHLGLIYFYQGRAFLNAGQLDEAESSFRHAEYIYENRSPEAIHLQNLKLAMGDLYMEKRAWKDALPLYEAALKELEKDPDTENAAQAKLVMYKRMGELQEGLRAYQKAIPFYQKFMALFEQLFGANYAGYGEVQAHVARLEAALEAKAQDFPDFWIPVKVGEEKNMMERAYAQWLVSELPDPSTDSMMALITEADRIDLIAKEEEPDPHFQDKRQPIQLGKMAVFSRIDEKQEIQKALNLLELSDLPPADFQVGAGECHLKFFKGKKELTEIIYWGDGRIRWPQKWRGDGILNDPEAWEEWLGEQGLNL